ncbi:MAG: hypothetical protein V2J24_23620 [Pseudomonadales bacterium]|jgi:hypothetical protein|nr:hypothetical protein [Pseudomonadales bacterium]
MTTFVFQQNGTKVAVDGEQARLVERLNGGRRLVQATLTAAARTYLEAVAAAQAAAEEAVRMDQVTIEALSIEARKRDAERIPFVVRRGAASIEVSLDMLSVEPVDGRRSIVIDLPTGGA